MVPEASCKFQKRDAIVLVSCDSHKPQKWPAQHDNAKHTVVTHIGEGTQGISNYAYRHMHREGHHSW